MDLASASNTLLDAVAPRSTSAYMDTAAAVLEVQETTTWLGLLARLVLWVLQTVTTILFLTIKLATISVPTFLFNLFSTRLTITMNATTLWVRRIHKGVLRS